MPSWSSALPGGAVSKLCRSMLALYDYQRRLRITIPRIPNPASRTPHPAGCVPVAPVTFFSLLQTSTFKIRHSTFLSLSSFRPIVEMLKSEFRIHNVVSRRVWPQSACAFIRLAISLPDPDGVAFQSQGQGPWAEMASREPDPERVESLPSSHIGNGTPSGCIFLSDSLDPGLRPGLSNVSPSGCGKLSNGKTYGLR